MPPKAARLAPKKPPTPSKNSKEKVETIHDDTLFDNLEEAYRITLIIDAWYSSMVK
ncbi:hypothetical protein EYZ11_012931 [Aspergillus tanneri]|uniref:Uncharacterized protein n=1 Tax=Aspergillus tanneri TaxID=1220188 RepID=A0A4S3IZ82_9EURO|nr:hypothetical protein EYZ11_012931 [Aspergillus tanneri]